MVLTVLLSGKQTGFSRSSMSPTVPIYGTPLQHYFPIAQIGRKSREIWSPLHQLPESLDGTDAHTRELWDFSDAF